MSESQSESFISKEDEAFRKILTEQEYEFHPLFGHEVDSEQAELWRSDFEGESCCITCRYWKELDGVLPVYGLFGGPKDWLGWCRRYPPMRVDDNTTDENPHTVTGHEDWCGEYARNEEA